MSGQSFQDVVGTQIKYDVQSSEQYQFVSTPFASSCYILYVKFIDGPAQHRYGLGDGTNSQAHLRHQ